MNKLLSVIIPCYNQEELVLKAIDSIPESDNIEVIVIDDCSTDDTLYNVMDYKHKNLIVLMNSENKGVGYSVNRGLDEAKGEYVVLLGSDDYFYTNNFNACLKELDGTDLVYFDLMINDGTIFHLDPSTKRNYCGSVKFMRREFIGDLRNPELRAGEDWHFYNKLLEKRPTEKFTNLIVKHYNYPRKNSLSDIY